MREHVLGAVGLEASDTQLDCDIANVALYETRQRLHLAEGRGLGAGELRDFTFDIGRCNPPVESQTPIPGAERSPTLKALTGPRRGYERHRQLTLDGCHRRHLKFGFDA